MTTNLNVAPAVVPCEKLPTEHYRLIATKTPLNSSVPEHWFNFRLVMDDNDFGTLLAQVPLMFGTGKAYGEDYYAVKIINERDKIVGMWMAIPLEGDIIKYFKILPPHAEIEQKIGEDSLIPYRERHVMEDASSPTGYVRVGLRCLPFNTCTLLKGRDENDADFEADRETHPECPEIKNVFDPLSAETIEACLRRKYKIK